MISWRALSGHLVALGLASAVALVVWTRKDPAASSQKGNVEVWGGSAEAVERIAFEAEGRSVRVERRKDGQGLWYVGSVDKTVDVKPAGADAGADAGLSELLVAAHALVTTAVASTLASRICCSVRAMSEPRPPAILPRDADDLEVGARARGHSGAVVALDRVLSVD